MSFRVDGASIPKNVCARASHLLAALPGFVFVRRLVSMDEMDRPLFAASEHQQCSIEDGWIVCLANPTEQARLVTLYRHISGTQAALGDVGIWHFMLYHTLFSMVL